MLLLGRRNLILGEIVKDVHSRVGWLGGEAGEGWRRTECRRKRFGKQICILHCKSTTDHRLYLNSTYFVGTVLWTMGGVEDLGRICGKEKYNFIDIRVKSNYSIRGNAGLLEISRGDTRCRTS